MRARLSEYGRGLIYRIYVTDALKILGGLDMRYADFIRRDSNGGDGRTSEEIITSIKNKLQMAQGGD